MGMRQYLTGKRGAVEVESHWTDRERERMGIRPLLGFPTAPKTSSVALRGKDNYSYPMKFRVVIEPDEDGVFVAECPALPGCVSQGKTREEALANIRDAIQGYLRSLEKHGEPLPSPITEEIVEVLL